MSAPRNDEKARQMAALYAQGSTLAEVAGAFSVTRQSVYKMLALRGIALRTAAQPPRVTWRGQTYSLRANGYFAKTRGRRSYLHRDMWEAEFGPIPAGQDVHHVDEDKQNNSLSNFALHTKAEHGRRHGFGGNQHTGSLGRRPVKW